MITSLILGGLTGVVIAVTGANSILINDLTWAPKSTQFS
jgi:hypothetical protein